MKVCCVRFASPLILKGAAKRRAQQSDRAGGQGAGRRAQGTGGRTWALARRCAGTPPQQCIQHSWWGC